MYFLNQKFFIVGISVSGYYSCKNLLELNASCYIYDSEPNSKTCSEYIKELTQMGAVLVENDIESVIKQIDVVVLSPAVAIDNEISLMARKYDKNIIGELELGYLLTKSVIIGVTGTNGKTTTCSLIYDVLKHDNKDCELLGNIGTPLTKQATKLNFNSLAVVEVSSFQLETVNKFCPHIACVLNIAPDHLSRHYNMENYTYLKGKILNNLRESEYAVLNYDDAITRDLANKTMAKVVFFSLKERIDGAYYQQGNLFFKDELIIASENLALKGEHNIYNALTTICVCKILNISVESIVSALTNFKGVKHRQQVVANYNGVTYVNDSKATNPSATITAVENLKKDTILLLGGRDKLSGYENLFNCIKGNSFVKNVVIFGQSRNKLYQLAVERGLDNLCVIGSFDNACRYAFLTVCENENILLSPACASFDEFSGYEQRGDRFIQLVNENILSLQNKKGELLND